MMSLLRATRQVSALAALLLVLHLEAADCQLPRLLRADVREHQLSEGRWAVSGRVSLGGFDSEVSVVEFLASFGTGSGNFTVYHHLRTGYPTLLFPHSSEDFVGSHSVSVAALDEDLVGCSSEVGHSWDVYAEFGTEAEAQAFDSYVRNVYVPQVQASKTLCAQADIGTNKLQCTTRTVHAKIRTCSSGVEDLRGLIHSAVDFYGDYSNQTLWQNMRSRYPSMRRPLSAADLTHRMYQLEGEFKAAACPAESSQDSGSGIFRRPDDPYEVDCCCKSPIDWEIEAEFESEKEAKSFLAFVKTTVPRMITLKGKTCSKTLTGVMDVSDHIYTADVAVRLCDAPSDTLVKRLQSLATVEPFALLTYLKFALPTMQSPLTRDELVNTNSLVHRTDLSSDWCSDVDSTCCCKQPTDWFVRGQFLSKKHARDFIRHMSSALPASIHTKLGICAAAIDGGLHELGCATEVSQVALEHYYEQMAASNSAFAEGAAGVGSPAEAEVAPGGDLRVDVESRLTRGLVYSSK